MAYQFPTAECHKFTAMQGSNMLCALCGGHMANHDSKTDDDTPRFNQSPMDQMITEFPKLLDFVMKQKRLEQFRSDIARLAAALIISGKESANSAVDTACYLYERIEAATEGWVK